MTGLSVPPTLRPQITDFIAGQCDRLGWYPSGLKKTLRDRREQKWRELAERLRS